MASYTVDTGQLRLLAEQIDKLQQQMDSVALRLTAFQMGSTMQMRGSAVLMTRIGDCKWAVINQSDNLGRMSRGLAEAAGIYERTEAGLKEPRTEAQARQQAEAAQENGHFWDPFLDNIPILEMIGFAVEATGRIVWNLGDVFANGVAWVMGGVESLLDNVEEFADDLLSNQFLFELVGEASVDVGLGAGVSAAIVAIVGAPVSVPAVLGLAAASAVICWVGDCLCEWATGMTSPSLLWIRPGMRSDGSGIRLRTWENRSVHLFRIRSTSSRREPKRCGTEPANSLIRCCLGENRAA